MVLCTCAAGQGESREVPIIKQINRVNDDGTYTFGYEAADGSFKIETRDVLGNVKGMFGYIDDQGQLKRVSYTANNGTGFQATGNIPGIADAGVTRRPVLVYKGLNRPVTERSDEDESSTPSYGDYLHGRRGYTTTTTEDPTTRPVRVLVTKRPVDNRNPNVIRRQLDRDRDDYSSRRFRYQQVLGPDPREVYRNLLLEQNNLKPDYPPRMRYYSPAEEDYPETAMERALTSPRYAPAPQLPPPRYNNRVYDEQQYPVPDRRFPFRAPRPYDDYLPPPPDYEAFRAAMNYLLQYLQYMRRMDPYPPAYPYPADPYNPRPRLPFYASPRLPPVAPIPVPVPSPFPPHNIPYINPNVQYSSGQENAQEALASLKTRMDQSDQSDSGDTRPPTASLIRMLLSRPNVTQRPSIRSVEILGTAKSTTSTTTEHTDVMEASS